MAEISQDIARYKVGDAAWWIVFRRDIDEGILADDLWMLDEHPKSLYWRGPYRKLWGSRKLPALHHQDFKCVTDLLTSTVDIEQFVVTELLKSRNTGEILCRNDKDEWIPESYLFDSRLAAEKERKRIMRMIVAWTEDYSD